MPAVKCRVAQCEGLIDFTISAALQTGCMSCTTVFPCAKCGRVHSYDGHLIRRRSGEPIYIRAERFENDNRPYVLVNVFKSPEAAKRHDCRRMGKIVYGEAYSHADLVSFNNGCAYLAYYNPKTEKWMNIAEVLELLPQEQIKVRV